MIRPPLAFFHKLSSRLGLLSLAGALLLSPGMADAAFSYWNGSNPALWTTDANWNTDVSSGVTGTAPISTSDVFFSTTTPVPVNLGTTLGQNFSIKSLSYLDTAATTSINGGGVNTLTIGTGGITVAETTSSHFITADVVLGASQTWTIGAAAGPSTTTFLVSGAISGTVTGLTKAGAGILNLQGVNTYTGQTNVEAGTLLVNNGGKITQTSRVYVADAAGTTGVLTIDGAGSSVTGPTGDVNRVGNNGNGTLNVINGGTYTAGSGLQLGHEVGSSGTVNVGTGGTINAAGLLIGNGNGSTNSNGATGTFNILAGGTVNVGAGGTGTVLLTNLNSTSTGIINIGAFGGSTAGGTLNAALIQGGAGTNVVNFNQTNDIALSTRIIGAVAVNQNGTGKTTLSATNHTFTGATTVNAGTLELTGGINSMYSSGVTAGQVTVNNGGTLLLSGTDTFGQSNTALNVMLTVNAGGTVKNSTGFYNPFRNAVFNGGTMVTSDGVAAAYQAFGLEGTVTVGGTSATSFTSVGATNNGINIGRQGVAATTTFDVANATSSAAADLVVAVPVADMGGQVSSLVKTGAGTMLFTTASTVSYTGTTSISAGGYVMNGTQTGAGNFTVDSGAMLAGTGSITTAAGQSMFVNGVLSVGDPTGVATAAAFSLTTSGGGSVVLGTGSVILMDVFTGAGVGDNTGNAASADRISLTGTLTTTTTGTLVLANPNALNGFAAGDQWKLFDLNAGAGSIAGNLTINDTALGLANGLNGEFDKLTGIYRIVSNTPQLSAQQSGLQTAAVQGQAVMAGVQSILGDINGRLFNLRAGWGEEGMGGAMDGEVVEGEGDGPEDAIARKIARSRQWELYATVNYANISLSTIGAQAGVHSQTWAPGVGIERHLSRHWALGFAANLLETHQTYSSNYGTLNIEGVAFSTYTSYVKGGFWGDLLYSLGRFDLDSNRNPGFAFPMAQGNTTAWSNAVQFNTGWNFRFQNNTLVTGPFVGLDYLHVTVDGYSESSGGLAALAYNKRSYDSLISRVGWSLSKQIMTDFAVITPQLRLSYERQNISNNNGTSVNLINQPFTATTNSQSPGQDYLVLGAGVNFQFTPTFNMLLTYQGQFFRQDMQAHYASVRFGYKF